MKKILVTGSAGFIGSAISIKLLERGIRLLVLIILTLTMIQISKKTESRDTLTIKIMFTKILIFTIQQDLRIYSIHLDLTL